MLSLSITEFSLIKGAKLQETTAGKTLICPADGAGVSLNSWLKNPKRYISFTAKALTEHSVVLHLLVYSKEAPTGEPAFTIRFGLLPQLSTFITLDTQWMNATILFPESNPGQLKTVCHGRRISFEEIHSISLETYPAFQEVSLSIDTIEYSDVRPESKSLPDCKLIDPLGQYKTKTWPGKVASEKELIEKLQAALALEDSYFADDWNNYGGWQKKKLTPGTGYFSTIKTENRHENRWWLVDPKGYAFFSLGPDCVRISADCRVDGIEKFMDWLPEPTEKEFAPLYRTTEWPEADPHRRRNCTLFSFYGSNLQRAFGDNGYSQWAAMVPKQLKQNGMNTLGNWSDPSLLGNAPLPYVTMLPEFPTTNHLIFRDFPDVFSPEYQENAAQCAKFLHPSREDPYMIGYFLRNEPAWAFVDHLIIADEVLLNPQPSVCKDRLIQWLKDTYETPSALSTAWNHPFLSFESLRNPIQKASSLSPQAAKDLREFSRKMLRAYVEIPSRACRSVDPNHLNLGMRWAWISDPDLVTGWECFDVFSINTYAIDPTEALNQVVSLGVDLPIIIGEFHFGALDAGLTATGLEGVLTQKDRGIAYRHYCEHAASHPHGVGCHYFQCYDQFALGRFDGENYNIGMFDICFQPYEEMMKNVRATSKNIYKVADGECPPYQKTPDSIPMIAY